MRDLPDAAFLMVPASSRAWGAFWPGGRRGRSQARLLARVVRIIVRDLDDEAMLKMMAADNNDAYNLAPGFILETVAAAKAFITKNKSGGTRATGETRIYKILAKFLAWPPKRVKEALVQLAAIGRAELSKPGEQLARPARMPGDMRDLPDPAFGKAAALQIASAPHLVNLVFWLVVAQKPTLRVTCGGGPWGGPAKPSPI